MTYTFKLARRLAAAPAVTWLVGASLLAACAGSDSLAPTDAPDSNWRDRTDLSVSVSPASVQLQIHEAAHFSGRIHTPLGDSVSAPVTWTATGGAIDSTGAYVAGAAAGTYLVIAQNTAGTLADTAHVTIAPAPAGPDTEETPATDSTPVTPTPAPAPAPAPTLTKVVLTPASVALLTGATQQVAVYGRLSTTDSVAVAVTYRATGGTISATGLYTAGSVAGTYRLIATAASGPADTAVVTLTAPAAPVAPPAAGRGIPMGQFALMSAGVTPGAFTLSLDAQSASTIITKISDARTKGVSLFLALTGGSHTNYLTNGVFDRAKWNAKMDSFNSPAIKSAIAAGVADGTILGASVMDEPHTAGAGDGNTWGPAGTMTKVRLDSLCGYVKALFPTLPVGAVHRHDVFEPTKSYRTCEFLISQYSNRIGDVTAFRNAGLAMAQRDGIKIAFSINILNGGTQDKDGTWDCAGTGGIGNLAPNCAMTPAQIRDWGQTLGAAGCALMMWQYNAAFAGRSENQQAFRDVATYLRSLPAKSCRRA